MSEAVELTLAFVTRFVLCVSRLQARERRGGQERHGGTCRCGARTDTGMRCNLWRELFDYRAVTVIQLYECWDHLA